MSRIYTGGGEAGKRALAEAGARPLWPVLADVAKRLPEREALVAVSDSGAIDRLTYAALAARVESFSAGLAGIGVRRGDRVAVWMTNTLEWIVASYAAMRLGAVAVPINTFLRPAEIGYVLSQSGARHLVMIDRFRKLDMPAMLTAISPAFASARPGLLSSPELPDLRNVVLFARGGGRHSGAFDFGELEARGGRDGEWRALADALANQTEAGDLAMIKYTSGSTGFPKGVMLRQGGMIANGLLHGRRIGVRDDDVFFSMMPFFHGGGSIYGQMTMLPIGGRLVFTEAFDPARAVQMIDREKATILFGVLAKEVVEAALAQDKVLPSVRYAHVPNEAARKVMPNVEFIFRPFGLTETYGPASITSPGDPPDRQESSGRLLDGNELRVVDPETGGDVAEGEVGEAWLRGNVMTGYWNNPQENARRFTEDGWLKSEDLVRIDAEGFVHYSGRIKLMLKVGGENVSIEEVEGVAEGHDAVAQCAAVGVPDERKGEAVGLYIVLRPSQTLDAGALTHWLQPRLARFKLPKRIVFIDALPRLANGKRDRIALQQWAQQKEAA